MAICVACGLDIDEAGKLVVKLDPAGGITCGEAGLAVMFDDIAAVVEVAQTTADDAQATADAGLVCCAEAKALANEADDTADAAQGSANTALDRVPNKIRWGFYAAATNAAGDVSFNHGLGGLPSAVVLNLHASTPTHNTAVTILNTSTVAVGVRFYDTTTGNALGAGYTEGFSWFAAL